MFDMNFKFSVLGLIIFMLPMVINMIYAVFPPVNKPKEPAVVNKVWEMIEQTTRMLYMIAICIFVSNRKIEYNSPWFYLALLFLVLYYFVWIRYFVGGRDVALLEEKFLFVPLPLAVFPVLYFLFSSIWLHNYIAAVLMVIFGIAHNIVSYQSFDS